MVHCTGARGNDESFDSFAFSSWIYLQFWNQSNCFINHEIKIIMIIIFFHNSPALPRSKLRGEGVMFDTPALNTLIKTLELKHKPHIMHQLALHSEQLSFSWGHWKCRRAHRRCVILVIQNVHSTAALLSGHLLFSSVPRAMSCHSASHQVRLLSFSLRSQQIMAYGSQGKTCHKLLCPLTGIRGNYCSPWQINGIEVQDTDATH